MKKIIFILIIICNLKNVRAQQNYQENLPFINKAYILTNKIKQIKITDETGELQRTLTYNIKGNIIEDIIFEKSFIREKLNYQYNKIDSIISISLIDFIYCNIEETNYQYEYNDLVKIALTSRDKNSTSFTDRVLEISKNNLDTLAVISYNELGQKVQEILPQQPFNQINKFEYEDGNLVKTIINGFQNIFHYKDNLLIREDRKNIDFEYSVNYKYDTKDRLIEYNNSFDPLERYLYQGRLVTSIIKNKYDGFSSYYNFAYKLIYEHYK